MRRRDFLKSAALTAGTLALPRVAPAAKSFSRLSSASADNTPLKIGYIREEYPHFEIPKYAGATYSDKIPETIDIAERCRLGINALTAITDPAADYEIYGDVNFFANPARMTHDFNDWTQNQEGFMEALPLLRVATGDILNSEVDPAWMRSTLQSIGPDGLLYIPTNGRPWAKLNVDGVNPVWRADGSKTEFKNPDVTQYANVSTCQRMIGTMTIYYLRDKNPVWTSTNREMIRRLSNIAIQKGDYCYYAPGSFLPNAKVDPNVEMPVGSLWGVSWNSRLIQGLAQYYRVSHDESALTLAAKITNYARYHSQVFDENGRWLLDPEFKGKLGFPSYAVPDWVRDKFFTGGEKFGGHSHGHMIAILGMVDFAGATSNRDLMKFCQSCFDWARKPGEEYGVSLRVGWFPEFYLPVYPSADSDPQADMIGIAMKLSDAGVGDYWDEVDRWVRNQYAEQQLTDLTSIKSVSDRSPSKPVAWNESSDRVAEKSLGAYGSSVSGNDWAMGLASHGIAECCTGSGTRTLYYIWNRMIRHQDGELRVNLLMNRASQCADIYSYIPYEGRVDLKIKEECRNVRLRAPEWIGTLNPEIACKVNGQDRRLNWEDRYVSTGAVKPGDKVVVTFPIHDQTVKERIGPVTYTLLLRGNTVVSIDPPGKNVPLYQGRERYRSGQTPWKEVTRFVSAENVEW